MSVDFEIVLLSASAPDWSDQIDQIRQLLGAPNNPELLPPHFVKTVLPKLGGQVLLVQKNQKTVVAGFLLPRPLRHDQREFTLRLHKMLPVTPFAASEVAAATAKLVGWPVVYYDPATIHAFLRTAQTCGGVEIGAPDQQEANRIRQLQQEIWGYHTRDQQDFLYPVDIYSPDFSSADSLVARRQNEVAGFLLGFYKLASSELPPAWRQKFRGDYRLESQLLGVAANSRGQRIGYLLKSAQAESARRHGIDVINWTVDPLQFRNARLNFGELLAIATGFCADYYPFRNELNRVTSSRFEITWLVATPRVQQALASNREAVVCNLSQQPGIRIVNDGWRAFNLAIRASQIAFEIPADWTALQREDLMQAQKWRVITDQLFKHYLGTDEGKYLVTGVGEKDGKKYLLANRVEAGLLERLAS